MTKKAGPLAAAKSDQDKLVAKNRQLLLTTVDFVFS